MKKSRVEKELQRGATQITVLKTFLIGMEGQETLSDKGKFASSHKEKCYKAINSLEEILERIPKGYGVAALIEKSGLKREIHRGINQISALKIVLTGVEEQETLIGKGEFVDRHKDRLYKSLNGLEETLQRILICLQNPAQT
jgi:hypothetical protein